MVAGKSARVELLAAIALPRLLLGGTQGFFILPHMVSFSLKPFALPPKRNFKPILKELRFPEW